MCDAAIECETLVLCEPLAECAATVGWVVARNADDAPPDWALEPEEDPELVDVEPGRCSATNHTSANSATAARTAWKGRDN